MSNWRWYLADAIPYIGGILIVAFFAAVLIGGNHNRKQECEEAGGKWLTQSQQCLRK